VKDASDESATRFRLAVFRLSRRIRRETPDAVSDAQVLVLASLHDVGPSTPGMLADREGVSPPAMNRTVNALEAAGLARRAADPDDGRRVLVEITAAGTAFIDETRRRRNAWMEQAFAALGADERATLTRAAELMERMLDP